MEKLFQLVMETYGIAGVIMLSPFVAVIAMWRENSKLHADAEAASMKYMATCKECDKTYAASLQAVNDRLVKAHEQRVVDAQAITAKMVEMVAEQSAMNRETNLALDRVGDLMSMIQFRKE